MQTKATSVDKLSQIMLYAVLVLLVLFLITGTFFLVQGNMGAGFIGLGIFFFGMGLVVLLQTMIMDEYGSFGATFIPGAPVKRTGNAVSADDLDYVMRFNAHVDFGTTYSNECMVYLCDDGLYFDQLADFLLHLNFDDISNVRCEKKNMEMDCRYGMDDPESCHVEMETDNVLHSRALMNEFVKRNVRVA